MKKIRNLALLLLLVVGIAKAYSQHRFEQLLREYADDDASRTDIRTFEVWHDRETGQEFICAVPHSTLASADKLACWPTGRSWK